METWHQCSQEELSATGRGLAGRLQADLLRQDQQQAGRFWQHHKQIATQTETAMQKVGVHGHNHITVTGNVPSFQWYLDTVYPEQFVPTKAVHQVELQTKVHTKARNQGSYSGLLRDYEIFANLHLTSV